MDTFSAAHHVVIPGEFGTDVVTATPLGRDRYQLTGACPTASLSFGDIITTRDRGDGRPVAVTVDYRDATPTLLLSPDPTGNPEQQCLPGGDTALLSTAETAVITVALLAAATASNAITDRLTDTAIAVQPCGRDLPAVDDVTFVHDMQQWVAGLLDLAAAVDPLTRILLDSGRCQVQWAVMASPDLGTGPLRIHD